MLPRLGVSSTWNAQIRFFFLQDISALLSVRSQDKRCQNSAKCIMMYTLWWIVWTTILLSLYAKAQACMHFCFLALTIYGEYGFWDCCNDIPTHILGPTGPTEQFTIQKQAWILPAGIYSAKWIVNGHKILCATHMKCVILEVSGHHCVVTCFETMRVVCAKFWFAIHKKNQRIFAIRLTRYKMIACLLSGGNFLNKGKVFCETSHLHQCFPCRVINQCNYHNDDECWQQQGFLEKKLKYAGIRTKNPYKCQGKFQPSSIFFAYKLRKTFIWGKRLFKRS